MRRLRYDMWQVLMKPNWGASKLRSMVGGGALMVVDNNEEVWKFSKTQQKSRRAQIYVDSKQTNPVQRNFPLAYLSKWKYDLGSFICAFVLYMLNAAEHMYKATCVKMR